MRARRNQRERLTHLKVSTADDQVDFALPLLARLFIAPFDAGVDVVERAVRAADHGDAEGAQGRRRRRRCRHG
jgi:hypothetical protein